MLSTDAQFALVYDALRADARRVARGEIAAPTSLVHEAWMRMQQREAHFESRQHFRALAAVIMRGLLVDRARAQGTQKRGGNLERVSLQGLASEQPQIVDVLALDQALRSLYERSERQARLAELRLFGGLDVGECAQVLECSRRTIDREWRMARAWLRTSLRDAP